MGDRDTLAERFELHRAHLESVALRMLGSASDADDAVQEGWIRLSRSDVSAIDNFGGWLTAVVARICLDMLRSRGTRREQPFGPDTPEPAGGVDENDPEHDVLLVESVGLALNVVLDTLAPAERVAFVLHDVFAVPFEEIAAIVGRSPAAARQLASRARRRVQRAGADPEADRAHERRAVDAFLAASREGNLTALLQILDPDVVLRADGHALAAAALNSGAGAPLLALEVRGARGVARAFSGRAAGALPALVNGGVGAVWAPDGQPRAAFRMTIVRGQVVAIEIIADPAHLRELDLVILDG